MRAEIADLVCPVLDRGLLILERLQAGQTLVFDAEHAILKGLLLTEAEAKRLGDFGGESTDNRLFSSTSSNRPADDSFLGARYALACWLDELFILGSPWAAQWNERKLEVALYGTNDRAWRFWRQARLAEALPGGEALEVFFWCVVLGFRGELRDEPDKLSAWTAGAKARILRNQTKAWSPPPEIEPVADVAILRGRDRFQRMIVATAAVILLLIPVLVFVVVDQLGR